LTEIQLLAFVIVPAVGLAIGWGIALYARREADRPGPVPGE
jgi:hypothetical protein